jgi:hypothetical protein
MMIRLWIEICVNFLCCGVTLTFQLEFCAFCWFIFELIAYNARNEQYKHVFLLCREFRTK